MADKYKLIALRLPGHSELGRDGRLMHEGTALEIQGWIQMLEKIPPKPLPGVPPSVSLGVQSGAPFRVRVVGPYVTQEFENGGLCRSITFNE